MYQTSQESPASISGRGSKVVLFKHHYSKEVYVSFHFGCLGAVIDRCAELIAQLVAEPENLISDGIVWL